MNKNPIISLLKKLPLPWFFTAILGVFEIQLSKHNAEIVQENTQVSQALTRLINDREIYSLISVLRDENKISDDEIIKVLQKLGYSINKNQLGRMYNDNKSILNN